MRGRINIKFLLILFIVGGLGIAVVGGLWVLKNRTDVTRSIRRGDEYMAEGEYRKARSYYGRAVGREPGNLVYLGKVESALLEVQAETADEAQELYASYISVLRHAADHHPTDARQHLRLLEELHSTARRAVSWGYTELMAESAQNMFDRVPATDPEHGQAKLYLGIARVSPWMHDRLTENEIDQGELDIEQFLADHPDNDTGWASLINARLAAAKRLDEAGLTTRTEEKLRQLRSTMTQARVNVPDGPEVLLALLNVARWDYKRDETSVDERQARDDLGKLVSHVRRADSPWLTVQTAVLITRLYWISDRPSAIAMLDDYLEAHPEAHHTRFVRARLHLIAGELDEADAQSQVVIDAELMKVGFLSQMQFDLKKQSVALQIDTAVTRWSTGEGEELDDRIADIERGRDRLQQMVTDPENDMLLMKARGQLAFASKDYPRAAALFNKLVVREVGIDSQTRIYAALSLEKLGELGAAVRQMELALEDVPGYVPVMIHQARLRARLGQFEEADRLLSEVLDIDQDNDVAGRLRVEIAHEWSESDIEVAEDPIQVVIEKATAAYARGEYEIARSTLLVAYRQSPDNLTFVNALIRIEMASGDTDQAKVYIEEALRLSPKNPTFLSYKAKVENPDRLEAIKQFMIASHEDDIDRAVETLLAMNALRVRYDQLLLDAERDENTEDIAEYSLQRDRALAEEVAFRAKAERLAPNHARFIEYQFVLNATERNWAGVEELLALVEQLDLDQAGGAIYRGRYAAAKNDPEGALRAFRLAVERVPYSATAWRMLAVTHRQIGNFPEALIAFGKSYENNPNAVTTAFEYAKLLQRTGNQARALIVIRNGRRLAPGNVEMRELWLTLEGESGDRSVELTERRQRYKDDPTDLRNAAALATFLGRTKPTRELLLDADGNERYTFERWSRLNVRGSGETQDQMLAEEQQAWYAEADRILNALVTAEERRLDWYELRAELLRARGEIDAGEELLLDYAASRQEREDLLHAHLALGFYQAKVDRNPKALVTYERALQFQDETDVRANLALADLLFRLNQNEAALPHFEAVIQRQPQRQIELQAVECCVRLGRLDEARQRLAVADAKVAPDVTSQLLLAAITYADARERWDRGDRSEAETLFSEHYRVLDEAARLDRASPMPYVMKSAALYQEYQRTGEAVLLDDALMVLNQADEVQVDFPRTRMTRIAIMRAKNNTTGAINELQRLLVTTPDSFEARQLLVQLLLAEGRNDAAMEAVQAAVDRNPSAVFWRVALGDLSVQRQRDAERELKTLAADSRAARQTRARIAQFKAEVDRHYMAAIETFPSALLLAKHGTILMGNDPPEYERVVTLIAEHPDEVEDNPQLMSVYARALASVGSRDEALQFLESSYRTYRENIVAGEMELKDIIEWYGVMVKLFVNDGPAEAEAFTMKVCGDKPDAWDLVALANVWGGSGVAGLSRQIELLEQALLMIPGDEQSLRSTIYSDLGVAHLRLEQHDLALGRFMEVLELDADNADILNNVAYLLSEKFDRPNEGLGYAERAAELKPSSAAIQDTMGWIYFRIGERDEAETYLRRAAQISPTAENYYHMACLYDQHKNDPTQANRYLSRAMELQPAPGLRRKINQLADDIRNKSGE